MPSKDYEICRLTPNTTLMLSQCHDSGSLQNSTSATHNEYAQVNSIFKTSRMICLKQNPNCGWPIKSIASFPIISRSPAWCNLLALMNASCPNLSLGTQVAFFTALWCVLNNPKLTCTKPCYIRVLHIAVQDCPHHITSARATCHGGGPGPRLRRPPR
jgi:hypothetical protein